MHSKIALHAAGKLICKQTPTYGKSLPATAENPYDELGYIEVTPCLYGDEADGLEPPPYIKYGMNLTAIKRNNDTYSHTIRTATT